MITARKRGKKENHLTGLWNSSAELFSVSNWLTELFSTCGTIVLPAV